MQGYRALREVHDRHARLLAGTDGAAITIGGDCGVELAPIGHAMRRTGGDLAIVWLDAHADLHTPASSPSGAFHGMVLRAALGDGAPGLVAEPGAAPRPEQVVLAGTRALDPEEAAYIAVRGIRRLSPAELRPETLVAAVEATGASSVFVHVDLDVLDPPSYAASAAPSPPGCRPRPWSTRSRRCARGSRSPARGSPSSRRGRSPRPLATWRRSGGSSAR